MKHRLVFDFVTMKSGSTKDPEIRQLLSEMRKRQPQIKSGPFKPKPTK